NVSVPYCDSPHPVFIDFLPTDPQVVLYFRFITAPMGTMSLTWVGPGGTSVNGGGWGLTQASLCFTGNLPIPTSAGAKSPGDWTARVLLNGVPIVNIPFRILPLPIEAVMTNTVVTQCDSPHPSITTFLTTDTSALFYIRFASPPPNGT